MIRSISTAVVDRAPVTDAETWDKREFMLEQVRSIGADVLTRTVTCPCGTSVAFHSMYRCFFCGLYFCTTCAERHFGVDRT